MKFAASIGTATTDLQTMDPDRHQARRRNNSTPSQMQATSTPTPRQNVPLLIPIGTTSGSTPRRDVSTPSQTPTTYSLTPMSNAYTPIPTRNVYTTLGNLLSTPLPIHYQPYPIQEGFASPNFGAVASVIPQLLAAARGRGRGRRQLAPRPQVPQYQDPSYNSQLLQALTAASQSPSPSGGRRGRRPRGDGVTSTRSRGGQRGARGARGPRGGGGRLPQPVVAASSPFSRLAFPVTDCCVRDPSLVDGGRTERPAGLNHVDNPCMPCADGNCGATAPTTEDLLAIPMEELVPRVEQVYNFIPGGLSSCNSMEELIDFSLYLGLSND
ncbi:unnamed protein product [Orchesella dallaii]|uniref:Uncharacterized protein n=1 Tax=Orchesella dallaii TaxID=48710 RepID=A0ABP1R1Z2_9HEXA